MKRLILLVLVLTPLGFVALDRLTQAPHRPEFDPLPPSFAFPEPPVPPSSPLKPESPILPHRVVASDPKPATDVADHAGTVRTVTSNLMANEDRALNDLRRQLDQAVSDWLAEANVPLSWKAPKRMVDRMILTPPAVELADHRDYGDLYLAKATVDFSRDHKAKLLKEYHRQVASHRLGILAAGLAFLLVCLATLAGYIRTDEATRGYYTNRLRLIAAASVGAAGVLLYQWIS